MKHAKGYEPNLLTNEDRCGVLTSHLRALELESYDHQVSLHEAESVRHVVGEDRFLEMVAHHVSELDIIELKATALHEMIEMMR